MPERAARRRKEDQEIRGFTKCLLADIQALERLISEGRIEEGVRRIGVEQELFLVDGGWQPAPVSMAVLSDLDSDIFQPELARFNLEINLPPLRLGESSFSELHLRLGELLKEVEERASLHGATPMLTGILPTLSMSDASLANITPKERYYRLNRTLTRMSGGSYRLHIQGADELYLEQDSVMTEGCNTSFQVHLQVGAEEFPLLYNCAQAFAAPILAASTNSPLLLGKRLWAETRIALFQQSIDTRRTSPHLRELTPRVRFGESWVDTSVLEVLEEDVARIPALFGLECTRNPIAVIERGEIPELSALQLYNGTVYRWNRPCYGITDGEPHLRIECRYLPSGPSLVDEVANAALWTGTILGAARAHPDIAVKFDFDDARANFLAAARRGLNVGFSWMNGEIIPGPDLIRDQILPLAREGLTTAGVSDADADKYLGIIEERVTHGQTGSWWIVNSLARMARSGTSVERMTALTAGIARRQQGGLPVHEWELADLNEGGGWRFNYLRVEQYMTTDLYTIKEDELVDLAALVMDWKGVRQIPVEDDQGKLVGLVSYRTVLRELTGGGSRSGTERVPVRAIMDTDPVTVSPDTSTLKAVRLMRQRRITSLPVVKGDKLVGIVSVNDFAPIVERLFEEFVGRQQR